MLHAVQFKDQCLIFGILLNILNRTEVLKLKSSICTVTCVTSAYIVPIMVVLFVIEKKWNINHQYEFVSTKFSNEYSAGYMSNSIHIVELWSKEIDFVYAGIPSMSSRAQL